MSTRDVIITTSVKEIENIFHKCMNVYSRNEAIQKVIESTFKQAIDMDRRIKDANSREYQYE